MHLFFDGPACGLQLVQVRLATLLPLLRSDVCRFIGLPLYEWEVQPSGAYSENSSNNCVMNSASLTGFRSTRDGRLFVTMSVAWSWMYI